MALILGYSARTVYGNSGAERLRKDDTLRLTGGLEPADSGEVLWEGNHKTVFCISGAASDALADGLGQCGFRIEKIRAE